MFDGALVLNSGGICVRLHRNDKPAEVCQATAAAVDQRAAAGLHVQGLGSAVEECPGAAAGRSDRTTGGRESFSLNMRNIGLFFSTDITLSN